jgi:hypothetical protein
MAFYGPIKTMRNQASEPLVTVDSEMQKVVRTEISLKLGVEMLVIVKLSS